nr:hypothetical protein [Tanacetum cinerariifolium]
SKRPNHLISQDFSKGSVDLTLFIHRNGNVLLLVQIYVDDIIFAASTPELCDLFANLVCLKFKMSLMGKISFFLGLQISQSPRGIFINQSKYALESLKKYGFESCDPVDTPMVEKSKLDEDKEGKAIDPLHYRDTRRNTSGSVQFLRERLISWSSKRQKSAAISSTEAEYIALSGCCAQILWMRSQLSDYGLGFNKIPMYCDNKSAIALCCNNVQHSRSKHIDIRYHLIKEQVENGVIELYFVNTEYQLVDLFTKALTRDRIEFLINKLGMRSFTPETLKQFWMKWTNSGDKMKEKGDPCILVRYSTPSKGYRVYNKRTRLIVESIRLKFNEIKEMSVANDTSGLVPQRQKALDYDNSDPVPQLQNVLPSADTINLSQQELDLLFGPLYDEFFNAKPTIPRTANAEENNDNQTEDEFTNPFCTPVREVAESSSRNIGNSNMHTFNQPQDFEYRWTKYHPLEQVYRNLSKPVQTRRQHAIDPEMCMFALTVSTTELKNIKEAMADSSWIEAMQEELHQFDILQSGLQIHQSPRGIFINQAKYASEILKKHGMEKGQSIGTPMATKPKLDADLSGKLVDQTDYHSKIGPLMYLTSSRPDIVQAYPKDSGFELTTFLDADHAGCIDTRKRTSGGIQFLGDKLVSWMSKKQDCIAMSSAKAEYVALSASFAQVKNGITELYFVRTEYQLADMFTKALPEDRFKYLVRRIGMRCLTPAELKVLANESA